MWPIFSPIIECHKPQRTVCKDPKGILTITVEPMRAFFLRPKRLLKTQIFERKANLAVEKIMPPVCFRFIEYDKPQGTNYNGPQAILTFTMEPIRAYF